jgi:hypothetical protein
VFQNVHSNSKFENRKGFFLWKECRGKISHYRMLHLITGHDVRKQPNSNMILTQPQRISYFTLFYVISFYLKFVDKIIYCVECIVIYLTNKLSFFHGVTSLLILSRVHDIII